MDHQFLPLFANSFAASTPQDSTGCSRRALLKQRKLCYYCKRKPTCVTERCPDSNEQLRFCSKKCLEGYKMEIFTQETLACLGSFEDNSESVNSTSASVKGEDDGSEEGSRSPNSDMASGSAQNSTKTSAATPVKSPPSAKPPTKRRVNQSARPHPSYVLNKRYWDEIKLQHDAAAFAAAALQAPSVDFAPPLAKRSRPSLEPQAMETLVNPNPMPLQRQIAPLNTAELPAFPPAAMKKFDKQEATPPILFLPIPIPVPVPFPILIPEGYIIGKTKRHAFVDDLD